MEKGRMSVDSVEEDNGVERGRRQKKWVEEDIGRALTLVDGVEEGFCGGFDSREMLLQMEGRYGLIVGPILVARPPGDWFLQSSYRVIGSRSQSQSPGSWVIDCSSRELVTR